MKKVFAFLGMTLCTAAGLWLALIAGASSPAGEMALALSAAVLFCAAILCAGYGNSIKGGQKNG